MNRVETIERKIEPRQAERELQLVELCLSIASLPPGDYPRRLGSEDPNINKATSFLDNLHVQLDSFRLFPKSSMAGVLGRWVQEGMILPAQNSDYDRAKAHLTVVSAGIGDRARLLLRATVSGPDFDSPQPNGLSSLGTVVRYYNTVIQPVDPAEGDNRGGAWVFNFPVREEGIGQDLSGMDCYETIVFSFRPADLLYRQEGLLAKMA
jgi:hypothetical protein